MIVNKQSINYHIIRLKDKAPLAAWPLINDSFLLWLGNGGLGNVRVGVAVAVGPTI